MGPANLQLLVSNWRKNGLFDLRMYHCMLTREISLERYEGVAHAMFLRLGIEREDGVNVLRGLREGQFIHPWVSLLVNPHLKANVLVVPSYALGTPNWICCRLLVTFTAFGHEGEVLARAFAEYKQKHCNVYPQHT